VEVKFQSFYEKKTRADTDATETKPMVETEEMGALESIIG
jgi:hypothetical protein